MHNPKRGVGAVASKEKYLCNKCMKGRLKMKIAAAFKVVPDDQDIKVAGDRTLDYSKAKNTISVYDLNALEVAAQLAAEFSLSARETEIVMLIARGFTTDNVAKKLVISPYTVNTHIRHVYEKVGIHKRSELIDYINRTGSDDDDKA